MEFKLSAQKREKNERLEVDFIPAVLYGKGIENQSLKVKKAEIAKVLSEAGESNLIVLDNGTEKIKVLVKEIQKDALKNTITHVDLYQVNMKEKVTTEIPLHFIGESKAVKELGGMLIKDIDAIEVECLPNDLVDHIDVDISILTSFDDIIRLHDLKLPKGMELMHDHNEVVAGIKEPKAAVEEAPVVPTPVAAPVTAPSEKK